MITAQEELFIRLLCVFFGIFLSVSESLGELWDSIV